MNRPGMGPTPVNLRRANWTKRKWVHRHSGGEHMRRTIWMSAWALTVLAACAGTSRPIIDTKGVNMAVYRQDLAECQQFGGEVGVASGTAKGAGAGAVVGGALGAVRGNVTDGAATGAIAGGASSALRNDRERQEVVKRCMRGRGYRVLN